MPRTLLFHTKSINSYCISHPPNPNLDVQSRNRLPPYTQQPERVGPPRSPPPSPRATWATWVDPTDTHSHVVSRTATDSHFGTPRIRYFPASPPSTIRVRVPCSLPSLPQPTCHMYHVGGPNPQPIKAIHNYFDTPQYLPPTPSISATYPPATAAAPTHPATRARGPSSIVLISTGPSPRATCSTWVDPTHTRSHGSIKATTISAQQI